MRYKSAKAMEFFANYSHYLVKGSHVVVNCHYIFLISIGYRLMVLIIQGIVWSSKTIGNWARGQILAGGEWSVVMVHVGTNDIG